MDKGRERRFMWAEGAREISRAVMAGCREWKLLIVY